MKKMLFLDIGKKFPIVHVVIGENNKKKSFNQFFSELPFLSNATSFVYFPN